MPYFIICWLLAAALASPLDFHDSQTILEVDYRNLNLTASEDPSLGWYDPRMNGGRFLDYTNETYGEPLNVIISALSDPFIMTDEGFRFYTNSIGYSGECLGIHIGALHDANLGDGNGPKAEQFLARQAFPILGACWESLRGGHHFRAWKQNGPRANSGAWFIGASKEYSSCKRHKIIPNGYNIGRDWLVDRAVEGGRWKGMRWKAEVEWRSDLIESGQKQVNHGIPQDGRIAILTVFRQ